MEVKSLENEQCELLLTTFSGRSPPTLKRETLFRLPWKPGRFPFTKVELARCWLSNGKAEAKGKRRDTEAEWQQEIRESDRHGGDAERKQLSGGIRMR